MPEHLGDYSSAPPWFSVTLSCDHCDVEWTGCAAASHCPRCGRGAEVPFPEESPDAE